MSIGDRLVVDHIQGHWRIAWVLICTGDLGSCLGDGPIAAPGDADTWNAVRNLARGTDAYGFYWESRHAADKALSHARAAWSAFQAKEGRS